MGINSLIFILDIQDPPSFPNALEYLRKCWSKIIDLETKPPKLSIFFHKYDNPLDEQLNTNMSYALQMFSEFSEISGFFPTSIQNNSGFSAFTRLIYLAIPELVIGKILEEEILQDFENQFLLHFRPLYFEEQEVFNFDDIETLIKSSAKILGISHGYKIQQRWLNYLIGDWKPMESQLYDRELAVYQQNSSLLVELKRWKSMEDEKMLCILVLEGVLEGIFSTLNMKHPVRIDIPDYFATWKVEL